MKTKLAVLIAILLLSGCSKPTENIVKESPKVPTDTKIIEHEVKQKSKATVGEIKKHGAEIMLPENTFDENVTVKLEQVNNLGSNGFDFISSPISVMVKDKKTIRLNQPAKVVVAIPDDKLSLIDSEENIFAAYHNGESWEYFVPDKIDKTNKTVEFTTYHFSSYAVGKLSYDEQLKYYAERMATNTWGKEDQEKNFVAKFEGYVNDLVTDAMGIESKETTRKVMQALVKEIPYMGGMLVSAANGDELEFAENFSSTLGKIVLDQMELEGDTAGDLVTIASTYGKAGANVSEEDYEEALKDITKGLATAIISKNLVGKMMVAGVEVIDVAITDWKDKSIEDAYQAYKNGADGEHGYYLDARNYDELRRQMRGINHKIYSDGIKAYCQRNKISIDKLSKDEEERIRKDIDIKLKNEFDNRISKEGEVDKQKSQHEKILKIFSERNLLTKGSFGYDTSMTLEDRIERLYLVMGQILSHTDKKFTTSSTAGEGEISIEDVAKLLGVWYSDRTNGKTKYFEELKKMGLARKKKATTGEYAWVLAEVIDGSNDEAWQLQNKSESYEYKPGYGKGAYSITTTYIGKSDNYYNPPYVNGESITIQANWSTPPTTIKKDEEISLTGSISVSANSLSGFKFSGSTGAWVGNNRMATKEGKTEFSTSFNTKYASQGGEVKAKLGEGSKGSKVVIETYLYSSNKLFTQYIYEWKKAGAN